MNKAKLIQVPRVCSLKHDTGRIETHPLEHFSEIAAYALLAEPGAGKSTLFKQAATLSENAVYISARNFIAGVHDDLSDKTLFIDGLDEARAKAGGTGTPLDAIRSKIKQLNCKRFRISCREADWLGALDAEDLAGVSTNQTFTRLHLEPLTADDVRLILANDQRVSNAEAFLQKAALFGLSALLLNPQTLDMLINAVKGETWPQNKHDVYKLATEKLAEEFNPRHQGVSEKPAIGLPAKLEAAGFLSAILLMADAAGLTIHQPLEGHICLDELKIPAGLPVQAALKTRLFNKVGEDEFCYVHRSVAEYLAARYIADQIKHGLMLRRVLALISGFDGGVVAALRGLLAWLCVLAPENEKQQLIEIDPIAIVRYGDPKLFSTSSKILLLNALNREAAKTGYLRPEWHDHVFAAIATLDMADHILSLLNSSNRDVPEQSVLIHLLAGLAHADTIPALKPALLAIIRDDSRIDDMRVLALQAFLHQFPQGSEYLLALTDEIRRQKIPDAKNALLGLLLDKLFPAYIPVDQVFGYYRPVQRFITVQPKNGNSKVHVIGNQSIPDQINQIIKEAERVQPNIIAYNYLKFWQKDFEIRLTDEDLPILLDDLCERRTTFLGLDHDDVFYTLVGKILLRCIRIYGSSINIARLYNWLSIGLDQSDTICRLDFTCKKEISNWIDTHPNLYFSLYEVGIKKIQGLDKGLDSKLINIRERFQSATLPNNFGIWWLDQALSTTEQQLADCCFQQAFWALIHQQGYAGLSYDFFEGWLKEHSQFLETYRKLLNDYSSIKEQRNNREQSHHEWVNKQQAQINARLSYFKQHLTEIVDGSAHPEIFQHLIQQPEYLNNDEALINAAKSGLRKIIERQDIPSPQEIFTIASQSRDYLIRRPFLDCIETLYQENPAILNTLSENLLGKALAFCFAAEELNHSWFKQLCLSRPAFVAKFWFDYISTMLSAKTQQINGLSQLAYDDAYQEVAKLIIIPALKRCPIRAKLENTSHLYYLLSAAINRMETEALAELVATKLRYKSMNTAQRVYWLVTGLIIEPVKYLSLLKTEINVHDSQRINHLFTFFGWRHSNADYSFPIAIMGYLLELLAPRCRPEDSSLSGFVTRAMQESDYVRSFINKLGNNPGEESAEVLDHLLTIPKLSAWHQHIRNAQHQQQLSRREAGFKHPDAIQVVNTLTKGKPANVADLAALAIAGLEEISASMHTSVTDNYKQFWNVDGHNQPKDPRPENSCSDNLLERLYALLLKYDVYLQPEAHQADDKRADKQLSYTWNGRNYRLPVEVKLDHSPDLWKAIHQQLIPLYTIAPETERRGLFLVIWFNDKQKKKPTHPLGLTPPKTAQELAKMLNDTLTAAEQKLIDVFVLDVSNN